MDLLRISMGFLWISMDFLWISMDFLWISIDFQPASQPSQPASQQAKCLTKCQAARRLKVSKQWLAGWLLGWLDWPSGQSTFPLLAERPERNKKNKEILKKSSFHCYLHACRTFSVSKVPKNHGVSNCRFWHVGKTMVLATFQNRKLLKPWFSSTFETLKVRKACK